MTNIIRLSAPTAEQQAAYAQQCCSKPKVSTLSNDKWVVGDDGRYTSLPYVNKVCLHCWAHWFGPVYNVTMYSKSQWDDMLEDSLKD